MVMVHSDLPSMVGSPRNQDFPLVHWIVLQSPESVPFKMLSPPTKLMLISVVPSQSPTADVHPMLPMGAMDTALPATLMLAASWGGGGMGCTKGTQWGGMRGVATRKR